MIHAYNDSTADAIWRRAWTDVSGACTARKNSNKGDSKELLHVAFGLSDPRQRFVYSRQPGVNIAFAIAEVVWIVGGRRDAAFLQPWNNALPSFTGTEAELHGAYGYRLRRHFGFDQLARAASALSNEPHQRQVVLQVWDAPLDLPGADGNTQSDDIPCNTLSLLKVAEGRLEWLQVMRSNDLILGLPYNLFQWTSLQEIVAGWIGVELGTYNHISDSLHVYDRDRSNYGLTEEILDCENLDDLRLPPEKSAQVFGVLEDTIENLANAATADEVEGILLGVNVPDAYLNWLRVMAAERLRRMKQLQRSLEMVEEITNPALATSLEVWNSRFRIPQ